MTDDRLRALVANDVLDGDDRPCVMHAEDDCSRFYRVPIVQDGVPMTDDRLRALPTWKKMNEQRLTGWLFFALFLLSIPFANWWLTQHGLVMVWGHAIPSAVWVVGFAFVFRDLAQLELGKVLAWVAIAVGVFLSWWVAAPSIAFASGAAFLWSESTDALIFTPLANRGTRAFLIGVSVSGYAASFVDSAIFMRLAFHSWDFIPLTIAKILFVTLATPVAYWVRRAVPRYQPV